MKPFSLLSIILLLLSSCNNRSTEDQVREWIAENAISIETVEASSGFEDLKPIGDIIEDARIVSLGEPTHGNREVFQLKHRLLEYLVTEKGFNIFALECPFGEAFDVNRYVVDGIGDPEKALAGIYFWTWDTQEVLELIKWMRSYNANPENKRKVKFYGFDPQDPQRAARVMLEYLKKADPILEKAVRPELGILEFPFSDPRALGRRQWIPKEYDSLSVKKIQKVVQALKDNKETYVGNTSLKEYQLAKQHARQIEIYISDWVGGDYNRDYGQAENIRWTLDYEGEDSKMIVWAHNFHVSNMIIAKKDNEGLDYDDYKCMGFHLKKWYGAQLKIVGLFYNQGEFSALDENIPSAGFKTFNVGSAKEGSLEHTLINANLSNAFLDFSNLPKNGPIYDWFNKPILTRYSWGFYNQSKSEDYYQLHKLSTEFDALLFFDKTTATVPIDKSDYDHAWLFNKKLERPTNLNFEESNLGETPKGWIAWSKFKRLGVTMSTNDDAFSGKKSLKIHRQDGPAYGEIGPNVFQVIDACPYRGKTIRLKAMAKANTTSFGLLHLLIEQNTINQTYVGLPPLFDSLDAFKIQSAEWEQIAIEAYVPESAYSITYSVHLRDFGTVWLDEIAIEIID
ncbi:erythromycin esterase family protein [uncultured Eudoraea sp.]|uniref:erythromycin esterase family protein n=1 Tax=uncultured Eudoraea sp. TaxID=1035614 RepID=UPI0026054D63|nr:erythromycin esterase family protein [uncultured Eudoraea sp.]